MRAGRLGFWATGLSVFVLWNAATLLGALAGSEVGDPRDFGLDAAAPAAFLAMLAPRLRDRQTWTIAVVAALVALAVVPLVPAGVPVLVAALVPAVAVLARRGRPMTWLTILLAAGSCYLLKLVGLWVPERWLEHPVAAQVVALLPVALLAALAAVQTFATGTRW